MNKYNRKTIRLKEYDYSSQGMYFITICTKNREKILSKIITNKNVDNGLVEIKLTKIGIIIEKNIIELKNRFNVKINNYVIMPNHIHMIIEIYKSNWADTRPTPTLSDIICLLKSKTTVEYNKVNKKCNKKIWQRNYYEHIIRDEKEMEEIIKYINYNPLKWNEDYLNN